jgi:hypothetical protein
VNVIVYCSNRGANLRRGTVAIKHVMGPNRQPICGATLKDVYRLSGSLLQYSTCLKCKRLAPGA